MDAERFDDIARVLGIGTTRRSLLRRLAVAGGVAGVASGRGPVVAARNECAAICQRVHSSKGPLGASCRQACKQCKADVQRICGAGESEWFCCPEGELCCYNCSTGVYQCGPREPEDSSCCLGT